MTKTRFFKNRKRYYVNIVTWTIFCLIVALCMSDVIFTNEKDLMERLTTRELIGSSGQRGAIMFVSSLAKHMGRKGLIFFFSFGEFLTLSELYKIISEYRRLLFREKLIREGLRAPDDYIDDERPLSIWQKVKRLLTKKTSVFDRYSRKEIKNADKNMEKYKKRHKSV